MFNCLENWLNKPNGIVMQIAEDVLISHIQNLVPTILVISYETKWVSKWLLRKFLGISQFFFGSFNKITDFKVLKIMEYNFDVKDLL